MSAGFDASPCRLCSIGDHENCVGVLRDNPSICTCSTCWPEITGWEPTDEELEDMRKEMGR